MDDLHTGTGQKMDGWTGDTTPNGVETADPLAESPPQRQRNMWPVLERESVGTSSRGGASVDD